jgi:WD40 repeat protein/serine/threonine protein kinase
VPTPQDRHIGHYRLVRELGRGAQGQVWLAEDTRLARRVALKVLSTTFAPSGPALRRFQREAASASKLDHPGICAVYETGEADGYSYIAMRYVEGETLARWIQTSQSREASAGDTIAVTSPGEGGEDGARSDAGAGDDSGDALRGTQAVSSGDLFAEPAHDSPRPRGLKRDGSTSTGPGSREEVFRLVRIVEKAARALHAAHEAGLIHRDVKPGNIMVTPEDEAVILDFGLARDEEGDLQTLTHSGDLLGTPAYMSPEQLTAHRIPLDRRTDVYSLGVTLYECLTHRRPFDAPAREAIYQQILGEEPPDPRRLNPALPRDLKVVIETSLEKNRERRYRTALELAEDLRRVRCFEPIHARPAGPTVRLVRWLQRNPVVATATIGVFLVLTVALGISLVLLDRVRREKEAKEEALGGVERERDAKGRAAEALRRALLDVEAERDGKARALAEREAALRRAEGLYLTTQASIEVARDPGLALLLGIEGAQRLPGSLPSSVLLEALQAHREDHVLSGDASGFSSLAVSPDGSRIAAGTAAGEVYVWDVQSGKLALLLSRHVHRVRLVAFSTDGARIVTVPDWGERLRLWDAKTGAIAATFGGERSNVEVAAFSPDGTRLATAAQDGSVVVWDARDGRLLLKLDGHECGVASLEFSPDGRRLLTAPSGIVYTFDWHPNGVVRGYSSSLIRKPTSARIWDLENGRELHRLGGLGAFVGRPAIATFSADGSQVLTALGGTATLWDAETGTVVARQNLGIWISAAFLLLEDMHAAVVSGDEVQVWELSKGEKTSEWREERMIAAAVLGALPDGEKVLINVLDDSTVRVRSVHEGKLLADLKGHREAVSGVALLPGARKVVTASADGTVRVWNLRKAVLAVTPRLEGWSRFAAVDPSGRWVVVDEPTKQRLRVLDAASGEPRPALPYPRALTVSGLGRLVSGLTSSRERLRLGAFAGGGRFVLCGGAVRGVFLWDALDGKRLMLPPGADEAVDIDVSADGRLLALAPRDSADVRIYEVRELGVNPRDVPRFLSGDSGSVGIVEFSPRGERLLATAAEGVLRVWDLESGEGHSLAAVPVTGGAVWSPSFACFTPDGSKVLFESRMGSASLWDVSAGEAPTILEGKGHRLVFASFSPDSARILGVDADGRAMVWDAATGERRFELAGPSAPVQSAVFSPLGDRILVLTQGGRLQLFSSAIGEVQREVAGTEAAVLAAAFSPDGARLVLASSDGTAQVQEVETGRALVKLSGHEGPVLSAAFSPDGARILTTSFDDRARIWDAASGAEVLALEARRFGPPDQRDFEYLSATTASFSPDGEHLAWRFNGSTVSLWDLASRGQVQVIEKSEQQGDFRSLRLGPSGETLLASHAPVERFQFPLARYFLRRGPHVFEWQVEPQCWVWDVKARRPLRRLGESSRGEPRLLDVSAAGTRALTVRGQAEVEVWELATGRSLARLEAPNLSQVVQASFSPNGELVFVRDSSGRGLVCGAASGKPVTLEAPQGAQVTCGVFSPDSARVLTGISLPGQSPVVRIWDAASGAKLAALSGHEKEVTLIACSRDGRLAASASKDDTVRVWDLETAAESFRLPEENVGDLGFSAGGRRLVTIVDRIPKFWPVDLLSVALERKRRDLSPRELDRYRIGSDAERQARRRGLDLARLRELAEVTASMAASRKDDPELRARLDGVLSQLLEFLRREKPASGDPLASEVVATALGAVRSAGVESAALLAGLSDIQMEAGLRGDAVRSLEAASRLPDAGQEQAVRLRRHRKALLPDLVSYASIDAALDEPAEVLGGETEWRFLRGKSEPPQDWLHPACDDSSWERGKSGFGFGYTNDPVLNATVIDDMRGAYLSVYLRAKFDVSAPGSLQDLVLSVCCDDGFVAHLNGVEVARYNAGLRGSRLAHDAHADAVVREPLEEIDFVLDAAQLKPGANVLALHGLNQSLASSDLCLAPSLYSRRAQPNLERDRRLYESFARAQQGERAALRRSYFEGRLLERQGRRDEAMRTLENVVLSERREPEPVLALARCLRQSGAPAAALSRLRAAIDGGSEGAGALWDAWFEVTAVDLGRDAAQVLAALPAAEVAAGRAAELRWALESLLRNRALRIDCGGEGFTAPDGREFAADRFYLGGSPSRHAGRPEIAATDLDPLHWSARWYSPSASGLPSYRIPLPRSRYRVTLHSLENYYQERGLRVFDVVFEGRKVRSDYAPDHVGFLTADSFHAEFEVSDGWLDVDLRPVRAEPQLSAIEVERLPAERERAGG